MAEERTITPAFLRLTLTKKAKQTKKHYFNMKKIHFEIVIKAFHLEKRNKKKTRNLYCLIREVF